MVVVLLRLLKVLFLVLAVAFLMAANACADSAPDVAKGSFVSYRDGMLYVFHRFNGSPVSVNIPPGLKVTGQVVYTYSAGEPMHRFEEARFEPARTGNYRFDPVRFNGYRPERKSPYFELLVARVAGKGVIAYEVDGKKSGVSVHAPERSFSVKFPDFEVCYNVPYTLSATGNIKLTKVKSGPSSKEKFARRDVWAYTSEEGILNGTMRFAFEGQGGADTVGYTFPFCPASAEVWLAKEQKPKEIHLPKPVTAQPATRLAEAKRYLKSLLFTGYNQKPWLSVVLTLVLSFSLLLMRSFRRVKEVVFRSKCWVAGNSPGGWYVGAGCYSGEANRSGVSLSLTAVRAGRKTKNLFGEVGGWNAEGELSWGSGRFALGGEVTLAKYSVSYTRRLHLPIFGNRTVTVGGSIGIGYGAGISLGKGLSFKGSFYKGIGGAVLIDVKP